MSPGGCCHRSPSGPPRALDPLVASALIKRIDTLRHERNAVILAHTYQPPEIQDVADIVGDSLALSRRARDTTADVIVFCGVRFMAETAAVLNPTRTVVMPNPEAGCCMADMITAEQLREFKAHYPGAPVVCYVNTTAEVKAESTVCCTSSNAVKVVQSLGNVPDILFVPDQFLGTFIEKQIGRKLIKWNGYCPTHTPLRPENIQQMRRLHPDAKVMVHPETMPEVQTEADYVLSTGHMCDLVKESTHRKWLVGTERGILHTLKKFAPEKEFHLLHDCLYCASMREMTTLENVVTCLERLDTRITVPDEISERARMTIEAMLRVV